MSLSRPGTILVEPALRVEDKAHELRLLIVVLNKVEEFSLAFATFGRVGSRTRRKSALNLLIAQIYHRAWPTKGVTLRLSAQVALNTEAEAVDYASLLGTNGSSKFEFGLLWELSWLRSAH